MRLQMPHMKLARRAAKLLLVAVAGAGRRAVALGGQPARSGCSACPDEGNAVLIESTEPAAYVVKRPDALTVLVELRNVSVANAANVVVRRDPIAGVSLEQATALDGQALARVRVALARPSEYAVRSARNVIRLELTAPLRSAVSPAPPASSGWPAVAARHRRPQQPISETPCRDDSRSRPRQPARRRDDRDPQRQRPADAGRRERKPRTGPAGSCSIFRTSRRTRPAQTVVDGPLVKRVRVAREQPRAARDARRHGRRRRRDVPRRPRGNRRTATSRSSSNRRRPPGPSCVAAAPAGDARGRPGAGHPARAGDRERGLAHAERNAPAVRSRASPRPPPSKPAPAPTPARRAAPPRAAPRRAPLPRHAARRRAARCRNQQIISGQRTEKQYKGNPITLDFSGADLRSVLRYFNEISGLNIIIDPSVPATPIDIVLRDVPWDQAFETLLRTHKLGYVAEGTIVRIAPISVLAEEEGERRKLSEAKALAGDLRVQTFSLSYAKAADITPLLVKSALSQRGQIQVDARTNTIIITDLPDRLQTVTALIARSIGPSRRSRWKRGSCRRRANSPRRWASSGA